jgi:hypothetical protein
MPQSLAEQARETMMSPQYQNLPAFSAIATGYGPCRSCLKTFNEGKEERLYIAYDPFEGLSRLPLPGHIFLHTEHCQGFDADGFPHDLLDLPLLFEGYAEDSLMLRRVTVDSVEYESQIEDLFSDPAIRFINIRNAEAGCYIARIDPK